jgi:hypothetical protein
MIWLDGSQLEMSLFDPVPEDLPDSLERDAASFLDEQSPLYFWSALAGAAAPGFHLALAGGKG